MRDRQSLITVPRKISQSITNVVCVINNVTHLAVKMTTTVEVSPLFGTFLGGRGLKMGTHFERFEKFRRDENER